MDGWRLGLFVGGTTFLLSAAVTSTITVADGGTLIEALVDGLLFATPGVVLLYIGAWLPSTDIDPMYSRRIIGWVGGGVGVVVLITGLRVLHPGVAVQYTSGTLAVLVAVGSTAGALIGVQEARALSQAKILEAQNARLERAYAVERQNERLRQTERRLEAAVAELAASNERLEQFAHVASHDLQEPLRMVTSYLQLLEQRYAADLDDDAVEFIAYAVDGAERMRALIDGLLVYSRVDTQGEPFQSVDLEEVLDDVLDDLQLAITEAEADVSRGPLPTVDGDSRQLQQVFQNLVSNAIEYGGNRRPRIHISADSEGSAWTISVRDNGIGIDPDDIDRIFDLFQRLHAVGEHAGSGIGLALCKRIVERHGGEIWVDSEPGVGSTFRFTLACAERGIDGPRLEDVRSR